MGQRWALIILLVLSIGPLTAPVFAHTTLGDLNNSPPMYRSNDYELNPTNSGCCVGHHVPGPLGYVWPGSGLDRYSGVGSNPPGYQSPFTKQKPIQVAADAYSPEGAILTSTADHDNVGDLIFALNFSNPNVNGSPVFNQPSFTYTDIAIYIPAPVFDRTGTLIQDGFEPTTAINWDHGDNSNIVTTITDNYGSIFVTRADQYDPFEPGSWVIYIRGPPSGITFTNQRDDWYYVRINQMKAPFTAGRYFFKMFLNDSYPLHDGVQQYITKTMPMENWAVLLVKGEVDPAIMTGTIRYGDLSSRLYGLPINLPGRVRAVGIANDPITGQPTGRAVEARGYFNATANGHYEIEGIAPGTYTIYASAAGMPEQKITDKVKVARGQSLHFDGYLLVGPQLGGAVFSKQGFGTVTWPAQRPMSIIIYNSRSYDPASIVAFSPINLTQSPYTSYVIGNTTFNANGFSGLTDLPGFPGLKRPKMVAFPWQGPTSYYAYTRSNINDLYGLFNGVGPAQVWWVDPRATLDPNTHLGSGASEFHFQFGAEHFYGVPTKFSGMVPQVFATWTDSLSPGRYYVRAFLNGYVQTSIDGTHDVDYSFDVLSIGPSNVFIPIDLAESCGVNVTVHFHNDPNTLVENPVQGPDPARYIIAEAFRRDNTLAAFNFTQVTPTKNETTILLNGLGMAGDPQNIQREYSTIGTDPRPSIKYSLARYRSTNIFQNLTFPTVQGITNIGSYDYGLPTDMYTIRIFMRGYIQALPPATSFDELDQPLTVNVGVGSCAITQVSTHMYRGGSINVTARSIDWAIPTVERNWIWNRESVNLLVYDITNSPIGVSNFVDVINVWNTTATYAPYWQIPIQNSAFSTLPFSYTSWIGSYGLGSSLIITNGSIQVERFGPDLPINPGTLPGGGEPCQGPGTTSSDPSQALCTFDFVQMNLHEGFLYNFSSYRRSTFRSNIAIYPGTYALSGWTYGYVQDNVIDLQPGIDLGNVYVAVPWLGHMADMNLRLIIGVNLTLTMIFKTERIISGTPYNASVRIRVFDDVDRLVAATTLISSDAGTLPGISSSAGFFANGNKIVNEAVPAGTAILTYRNLAGSFDYVEPNSAIANIRTVTLFSGDHGIWGRSSRPGGYSGDWTVMVDVVNWYPNITSTSRYPPVPGLLQGESPYFFPYNHLGPYAQNGFPITPLFRSISNAPLSGEASAEFELDLRGYIQGITLGMNWEDDVRTMSWASLQIVDNSGYQYYWYTWDGWFDGYLNPGTYKVTITEWATNQGHAPIKFVLPVSSGERARSLNFILFESNIPIPEFSTAYLSVLTLGIAACLIRVGRIKKRNGSAQIVRRHNFDQERKTD